MRTNKEKPSEFTLALNARAEENPVVVWPFPDERTVELHWEEVSYEKHPALDDIQREPLVRVFPQTGKDVAFLRMLKQREDKFAPGKGGGILVKSRLIFGA